MSGSSSPSSSTFAAFFPRGDSELPAATDSTALPGAVFEALCFLAFFSTLDVGASLSNTALFDASCGAFEVGTSFALGLYEPPQRGTSVTDNMQRHED